MSSSQISPAVDTPTVTAWTIRASDYIEKVDIGDGEFLVWNRYLPIPILLNQDALDLLMTGDVDDLSDEERAYCQKLFLSKHLAYEGDVDPSLRAFERKIGAFADELEERDESTIEPEKQFYEALSFSNDPCNVGCTYCMIPKFEDGANDLVQLGKKPPPKRAGVSKEEKLAALKKVLDQHLQSRIRAGEKSAFLTMSGGEVLAQWTVVKGLIEYSFEAYPELEIAWYMNSSLTILSEEQADFFRKYNVGINTSIDGYKENHDKYRTYHNGKGTFDDVMAGIKLFNERNPEHAIIGFQGTIADPDEFDANKMFDFVSDSFDAARLAPNLLGVSEEVGEKQADLMMDLYLAGKQIGFQFDDTVFGHFLKILRAKGEAKFDLYCKAMSNREQLAHVTVNMSTLNASRSCSFVPSANVPLDEVGYDLFDQALWDQNLEFSNDRIEAVKKHCSGCEIAGACGGSCVLSGLDANNQLNPGGCAYLKRLWKRMVAEALGREGRIPSRTAHKIDVNKMHVSLREKRARDAKAGKTEPVVYNASR